MASFRHVTGTRLSAFLDDELVRRAQAGDEAAFERLYREHGGRVYALCLRMSGDPGRAAELTQDVFVHVWKKLGSFRGNARFSTWLQRVTVNFTLNALKSERRRLARVEPTDEPARYDRGTHDRPVDVRIDLENAIATLPPGARQVFVLHDVEGFEHHEIAQLLGVSEGTSKSQVHKARMKLRALLSGVTAGKTPASPKRAAKWGEGGAAMGRRVAR